MSSKWPQTPTGRTHSGSSSKPTVPVATSGDPLSPISAQPTVSGRRLEFVGGQASFSSQAVDERVYPSSWAQQPESAEPSQPSSPNLGPSDELDLPALAYRSRGTSRLSGIGTSVSPSQPCNTRRSVGIPAADSEGLHSPQGNKEISGPPKEMQKTKRGLARSKTPTAVSMASSAAPSPVDSFPSDPDRTPNRRLSTDSSSSEPKDTPSRKRPVYFSSSKPENTPSKNHYVFSFPSDSEESPNKKTYEHASSPDRYNAPSRSPEDVFSSDSEDASSSGDLSSSEYVNNASKIRPEDVYSSDSEDTPSSLQSDHTPSKIRPENVFSSDSKDNPSSLHSSSSHTENTPISTHALAENSGARGPVHKRGRSKRLVMEESPEPPLKRINLGKICVPAALKPVVVLRRLSPSMLPPGTSRHAPSEDPSAPAVSSTQGRQNRRTRRETSKPSHLPRWTGNSVGTPKPLDKNVSPSPKPTQGGRLVSLSEADAGVLHNMQERLERIEKLQIEMVRRLETMEGLIRQRK